MNLQIQWRGQLTQGVMPPRNMIKTFLNKGFWILITLAGLYLMFIELGMLVSETHAFEGMGIFFFIMSVALGFFLFFLGVSKLRGKPRWANN